MKIYHTETQEDYDALMVELERQGIGTLGKRYWEVYENQTVVIVHALCRPTAFSRTDTAYGSLERALQTYPNVPIQKYKAKAEEKMRFTKENVEKVIDEYFRQADLEPCGDLIAEIHNLDDTPEKVVVPKFVADYLEDCKKRNIKLASALCPFKNGYGKEIELWFDNEDNNRLFALAWINGYEVEKEPLYHVVNKEDCFMIRRYEDGVGVMKISNNMSRKQYENEGFFKLTEKEIKDYDERFWPFAVPAND